MKEARPRLRVPKMDLRVGWDRSTPLTGPSIGRYGDGLENSTRKYTQYPQLYYFIKIIGPAGV